MKNPGPLGALWRYRVGDYRIICDIQDAVLCVLVVNVRCCLPERPAGIRLRGKVVWWWALLAPFVFSVFKEIHFRA